MSATHWEITEFKWVVSRVLRQSANGRFGPRSREPVGLAKRAER